MSDVRWNDGPLIGAKRTIPAGQLRSGFRQLRFTNGYTIIAGSDSLGTATVTPGNPTLHTLPTISLDQYPTKIWITDPEGYWMTFVGDGYSRTFFITARVSDQVLQMTDPWGLLNAGSFKWMIRGFRKFERPRIIQFTLNAEVDGPTYSQAVTTGANA